LRALRPTGVRHSLQPRSQLPAPGVTRSGRRVGHRFRCCRMLPGSGLPPATYLQRLRYKIRLARGHLRLATYDISPVRSVFCLHTPSAAAFRRLPRLPTPPLCQPTPAVPSRSPTPTHLAFRHVRLPSTPYNACHNAVPRLYSQALTAAFTSTTGAIHCRVFHLLRDRCRVDAWP